MKMLTACHECGEHVVVNYEPEDKVFDPEFCPFCRHDALIPLVPCLACMRLTPSTEICDGLCVECNDEMQQARDIELP